MKRQLDCDDRAELIQELMAALTSNAGLHDKDNMTALIAQLTNLSGVTDRALKKARRTLRSFSRAKWKDISGKYNLPEIQHRGTARCARRAVPPASLDAHITIRGVLARCRCLLYYFDQMFVPDPALRTESNTHAVTVPLDQGGK
jgi:hypothetical protein